MDGILRKEVRGLVEGKCSCVEHSSALGICVKLGVRNFSILVEFLLCLNLLYVLVVSFLVYFVLTLFNWIWDFVWILISLSLLSTFSNLKKNYLISVHLCSILILPFLCYRGNYLTRLSRSEV